jgi:hypothetical protein
MKTNLLLIIVVFLAAISVIGAGCQQPAAKEEYCAASASANMSFSEAKQIALASDCIANGTKLTEEHFCLSNSTTGTWQSNETAWWIDLNKKVGCAPTFCVINIATKKAEFRLGYCTGALLP